MMIIIMTRMRMTKATMMIMKYNVDLLRAGTEVLIIMMMMIDIMTMMMMMKKIIMMMMMMMMMMMLTC